MRFFNGCFHSRSFLNRSGFRSGRGGQAVHGLHHGVRGDGRAGHGVNPVHRQRLADELLREVFLRALLAQTGRLRRGVHRQCGDRVVLIQGDIHGDLTGLLVRTGHHEAGRARSLLLRGRSGFGSGGFHRSFRSGRFLNRGGFHSRRGGQAVHGLHHGVRGDGCAGHGVNPVHGQRLADELLREVFLRALLAQAGRLRRGVHRQRGDRVVLIQGDVHGDLAGLLVRAGHHEAGRARGLFLRGGSGFGGGRFHSGSFLNRGGFHSRRGSQAIHSLDHGVRGDGCAGHGVDPIHGQRLADELLREVFLRALLAQAGRLCRGVHRQRGDRVVLVQGDVYCDLTGLLIRAGHHEAGRGRGLFLCSRGGFGGGGFHSGSFFNRRFHGGDFGGLGQRAADDLAVLHGQLGQHSAGEALGGHKLGRAAVGHAEGAGGGVLGQDGHVLGGGFHAVRAVDSVHHSGGSHGRAGQGVHALAQGQRDGLADELVGEVHALAVLADARGLRGGVHGEGCDVGVVVQGDLHLHGRVAEAVRAALEGRAGLDGRFRLGLVDGVHHGARGQGRAGQGVHALAQGQRDGLADKLIGEVRALAVLADAGRLGGGVHGEAGDVGVVVQLDGDLHGFAAEALRAAGQGRAGGQGRGLAALVRGGCGLAVHDQGIGDLVHTHGQLGHGSQSRVAAAENRLGGVGRAGERLKRAAVHGVQTEQAVHVGLVLPARAEAVGLLEGAVADLRSDHLALGVHAQDHGHGAGIALLGRLHGVADDVAVFILGNGQALHVLVFGGDVHRLIGGGGHHLAEGRGELFLGQLLDGALGDRVGEAKRQRRHQGDDRQNDKCRQALLLSLVFHACDSSLLLGVMGYRDDSIFSLFTGDTA